MKVMIVNKDHQPEFVFEIGDVCELITSMKQNAVLSGVYYGVHINQTVNTKCFKSLIELYIEQI